MNVKQLEYLVHVAEPGSFSKAAPALGITPLLDEPLCLVQPAPGGRARGRGRGRTPRGPLPLRELPGFPLIVPDRSHAIRKLLETQAMLAGLELDIAWEVASVPSIIDLVCAGYGYAVLSAGAVAASGRAAELAVRPLVEPQLGSVPCLATSAHKRPTPLVRHESRLLRGLVEALPMPRLSMPTRHS